MDLSQIRGRWLDVHSGTMLHNFAGMTVTFYTDSFDECDGLAGAFAEGVLLAPRRGDDYTNFTACHSTQLEINDCRAQAHCGYERDDICTI